VVAVASLLLVVAVSLVITRVATVILVATGMSRASARFQARSAFTGSGFTTRESESVVDHPVRRRTIMALMLLGNAGIVAAASSLILGFRGGSFSNNWKAVLELVAGLLALLFISRSRWVDRHLTSFIGHLLHTRTDLPTRDLGGLLQLAGDYSVTELAVEKDDWVADRTLRDLGLRDEGVVVLGLTRSDGDYLGAPTGSTQVRPGDILVLYGREDSLNEIDRRRAGYHGDQMHVRAIARLRHQRQRDRTSPGG
jgi:hypothetical protein